MNVVFARGSSNRKTEFQLVTSIEKDGGKVQVRKSPAHEDAKKHALSLSSKKKLLEKSGIACRVAEVIAKGDSVVFPYIAGHSVEEEITAAISRNQNSKVLEIIDEVFSIIDSVKTVRTNPTENTEFIKYFGSNYSGDYQCVSPGCVDMNLDNFIRTDDGKLTLIDYEWVFDFPIPVDFIKARLIHSLFSEMRLTILKKPGDYRVVEFSKNCYIPLPLYERYQEVLRDFENYTLANTSFLNALQFTQSPQPVNLRKPSEKMIKDLQFENPYFSVAELDNLRLTLELTQQHVAKLETALAKAEASNSTRSQNLKRIKSVYSKARSKLSR